MFDVLHGTSDDFVAIRMHTGTPEGYEELYDLLVELTKEHGVVNVYEETRDWTAGTFLSHLHGVIPDLRMGPAFDINRYAAVGDSFWAKLMFQKWKAITPIWPVAPDEMRFFQPWERTTAIDWCQNSPQQSL